VVGASANVFQDAVKAYAPAPSFLQIGFGFSPFGGEGPRHMIFSLNDDIFVLPRPAFGQKPATSVATIEAGTDAEGRRTAVVSGSNLEPSPGSCLMAAATVAGFDDATGALTVIRLKARRATGPL